MPQRTPVSILIVNEHAEEIKLATIGFRGFFSDCRVDAAYSAEEARTLSITQGSEWAFILVDEGSLSGNNVSLIADLKRLAIHTSILLQSERSDGASAIQAMQAGADFFLAKQSPAFLTELLFCAREAVEKRSLRMALAHSDVRHHQLLDSLSDVFYELDAEGHFVSVGQHVSRLLGYTPQELVGLSHTILFSQHDQSAARFRFNERRSGTRSAQRIRLNFQRKFSPSQSDRQISAEVSARGLYDVHRRFLGTVGVIRNESSASEERETIHSPTQQAKQLEELHMIVRGLSAFSQELGQPITALREEAANLLDAVHTVNISDRLARLRDQATLALSAVAKFATIVPAMQKSAGETVNDLLDQALAAIRHRHGTTEEFRTEFGPNLLPYEGNKIETVESFRRLLLYVRTLVIAAGRNRKLVIRTRVIEPTATSHTLEPPPLEIEIDCAESERDEDNNPITPREDDAPDFPSLHRLIAALDGTLNVSLPPEGPFRVTVRLPVADGRARVDSEDVIAPSTPSPLGQEAETPSLSRPTLSVTARGETRERRASPRIATTLKATVSAGSVRWEGTVANLSMGGACLTLSSDFPNVERQDVSVVLRTAIGILELGASAFIRHSEEATDRQRSGGTQLITIFQPPKTTDASILASLIEAARDHSLSFSLDILLAPRSMPQSNEMSLAGMPDDDRRESIRVQLTLSVRLESYESHGQSPLIAQAVNISRDGACLLVRAHPQQLRGALLLHFPSSKTSGQPGPHEPGAPDSVLPAHIVWTAADPTAPAEFRPQNADSAARIGVKFLSMTPYAERELTRLVRQHLVSSQQPYITVSDTSVVSVHRECRNPRGQAIAVMDDHLKQPLDPDVPILIIAPGYGQTARDYSALSYYLANHRLRVLRYDHSNHVGISDGELQNTTLRGMQSDLAKVVEFVRHTWPSSRIVILASDLAARATLKMATQVDPVDLLILGNPVIDVGALLMTVHGHDLVADYGYGLRRGITNLLSFNVNLDQFVGDLIAGRLTDLPSTLEDMRLLRSPLAIVTSPQNESSPLPPSDMPHAFMHALNSQTRIISVSSALTSYSGASQESEPLAFRQILELITSVLAWPSPAAHMSPAIQQALGREQRVELEQTRLHRNLSHISREALGLAHLQQLSQLANLHDYRKLLDDLYAFLTPLDSGMTVLDAGIGQSDVTRAMLINHAYRGRQRGFSIEQPPLLIGLGRSNDQVHQARQHVRLLQRELAAAKTGSVMAYPPLSVGWMRTDWTQALPFQSRSIHRIVCNLSLSFVGSPQATLHEWQRVLHPEGCLVFTVFHPDTDLSPLYRRHLRLANQDEFSNQAQVFLHYLGRLREAIRHGILHTFDHTSLTSLLRRSGDLSFRINHIFNGQAFVVIVGKRISSSPI